MEDEEEANECTRERALNFKICKIIWTALEVITYKTLNDNSKEIQTTMK
jgi:hypothetical protein